MRDCKILEQLMLAMESASLCVRVDANGHIVWVSETLKQLDSQQAISPGLPLSKLLHADVRGQLLDQFDYSVTQQSHWQGTVKLNLGNRRADWFKAIFVPLFDDSQNLQEQVLMLQDISREVFLDELLNETRFDHTTGLPTRVDLIADIKRVNTQTVAIIDIRKFRSYADFYGLEFGDRLLFNFSESCKSFFYPRHINIYRLYGDKFALLPSFRMVPALFEQQLQRFYAHIIDRQIEVNGANVALDIAIGMGVGKTKLLQLAESALARAKTVFSGQRIHVVNEREFSAKNSINWLPKIQSAIKNNRFINYYQPIRSSNGQRPDYYEALVRMRDGEQDIPPGFFLDKAKTTRYYPEITRRVVEQAVVHSAQHNVQISVNVSIEDILNAETVAFITDQLEAYPQSKLIFEITETESTEDFSMVDEFTRRVRSLGAEIAIDDFGVGYSNFSRLIQLRPDYLKIDGSIIKNILEDASSASILNGMISICRELKIPMVAEFVETEQVNGYLTEQQIEFLQGYYIGRPSPDIIKLN
ncbi:hypothetical protein BFR57_07620 [Idiomarina sp. MD25a]|uniref:EAL domain-containing protein n=1 Tax=Idiomarina sp. MD25a TaxID=1889913 RepID=UPI0008F8C961|nr:GGDEF domain-containing phosphodiesterase [Idiomarina sp. MD25a]OIN01912.1 hypothetical protein BFR57_07620 [Idiomarina sp. MD25a]